MYIGKGVLDISSLLENRCANFSRKLCKKKTLYIITNYSRKLENFLEN